MKFTMFLPGDENSDGIIPQVLATHCDTVQQGPPVPWEQSNLVTL